MTSRRVVAVGDNGQAGIAFDDVGGVHLAAVDNPRECGLGQACADIGGDVVNSNRVGK